MRDIIFRGKRIDNDEWVYGDLVRDNIGGSYVFPNDAKALYTEYKVNPETVGQYSGLTDKNGTKIFEGDVIEYTRYNLKTEYNRNERDIKEIGRIFWNDNKHAFYYRAKLDCGAVSGLLIFDDDRCEGFDIKVIGNEYDNSELIEVDKD